MLNTNSAIKYAISVNQLVQNAIAIFQKVYF